MTRTVSKRLMALAAIVGIIIATVLATVPSFRAHSDSYSPADWPNKTKPTISWPTYNDSAWVKETSTGSEVKYQVKDNVLYMEPNNYNCDAKGDNCKAQAQFGTGDYSSSDHKVTVFAKIGQQHWSEKIYTHKPDGTTTKEDTLKDGDIRAIVTRGYLCFPGTVSLDNAFEGTNQFENDGSDKLPIYGGFGNLVDISGLSNLKSLITSNGETSVKPLAVTSMKETFANNYTLEDLTGLDDWDTSKVTSFYYTFGNMLGYEPVEGHISDDGLAHIAKWDVSHASDPSGDMSSMFSNQMELTNLQSLSAWKPYNAINMSNIFYNNSHLTSLAGLENWLPSGNSQVSDLSTAFAECGSLTSLDALKEWDVRNVAELRSTFLDDRAVTSLEPLTKWNVSSVKHMSSTFKYCSKVTSLTGLEDWDTSSVTDMSSTFSGMADLTDTSALEKWKTSNVTTMSELFNNDSDVHDLSKLTAWDLSALTSASNAFYRVDWYIIGIPAKTLGGQKFLASSTSINYCNDVLHNYGNKTRTDYEPARHFSEAYQSGTLAEKTIPEWYTAYGSLTEGDTGYSAGVVYERPARLTITKQVTDQPTSEENRKFTIKLKLSNVSGKQTYEELSDDSDTATITGSKSCTDGECTFQLTNGQSVYLSELPPTTYTVTETDVPDGYKLGYISVCDNSYIATGSKEGCNTDMNVSKTGSNSGTLLPHQGYYRQTFYDPDDYDPDKPDIGTSPDGVVVGNDYEIKPLTLSIESNVMLAYGVQTDTGVKPTTLAYGKAKAGQFTLKLCPADTANNPAKDPTASSNTGCISTTTAASDAPNAAFDPFQLKKEGTYEYTITQVAGTDSSVKYDHETFDVTIGVKNKDNVGYLTADSVTVTRSGKDAFGATQPSTEVKQANAQTDAKSDSYSLTQQDTDPDASGTIKAKTGVLDVRNFTNWVPQTNQMPATGGMGVTPFILLALVVFVGGAWLAFGRRK